MSNNTTGPFLMNKMRINPEDANFRMKSSWNDYDILLDVDNNCCSDNDSGTTTVAVDDNKSKNILATEESDIEQMDLDIDIRDYLNSTVISTPTTNSKLTKNFVICGRKYSCDWNIPWVVFVNSFVQISMYIFSNEQIFNLLIYTPYKKKEIWRFISYTLLHSDIIHLSLNIILQILAAFILETEQGHCRVLLIYLSGGIAGAIGTAIFQPKLLVIGSSAGVYSLLISHIPHLIMNFHSLRYKYFRMIALIFLCASDAGYTLYQMFRRENTKNLISISAHLGGIYNGLLLGFIIYSRPKLIYFDICRYILLFIYIITITFSVIVAFKCDVKNSDHGCLRNFILKFF